MAVLESAMTATTTTTAASQGFVQVTLIWGVYGVAVVVLLSVASLFVYLYQTHRERSAYVTTVCIFTITCLLATVLLLPVDVALVSSTTSSARGVRKDWATQDKVDQITNTLRIVYYLLYSLDAVLCLLVIPFTYFWYEEYDEVAEEEGSQSFGSRFWAAARYTAIFFVLCVALFVIGFFAPVARDRGGGGDASSHLDLDYFKRLLTENHGERALTFALGLLTTLGVVAYCFYTAVGLALLPVALIKSAPGISSSSATAAAAAALDESVSAQLESNVERQRQLEGRAHGDAAHNLSSKDQRELEALKREERTLRRHQRLAEERAASHRHQQNDKAWFLYRAWHRLGAILRPIKLLLGLVLLLVVGLVAASMLITAIDKAANSICKRHCGYLLGHTNLFQPVNYILVATARYFPVDYALFLLLTLVFFGASVTGIATLGIRLLWITVFRIRKAHTSPQALLIATVLLTLTTLATNYAIAMVVAPQYATFGPQTFIDSAAADDDTSVIRPCTETTSSPAAGRVCTPSVASTFLNRITVNFPFFGLVDFWAQFVFLAVFLLSAVLVFFRTPRFGTHRTATTAAAAHRRHGSTYRGLPPTGLDDDDEAEFEEDEEEGLLASTSRRLDATWEDIAGRQPRGQPPRR